MYVILVYLIYYIVRCTEEAHVWLVHVHQLREGGSLPVSHLLSLHVCVFHVILVVTYDMYFVPDDYVVC